MALQHAVDERLDLVLLADVAGARLHAPVLGGRGRLVERLLAPPADHHLGAERGELQRGGSSEPGAAADDERYLPVE